MILETLFFAFAAVALGAAVNVLVQRHVLYSALSLILMLGAISGLYVLLNAELLAFVQIIVYAGAIMVLFVFVIMLLNVTTDDDEEPDRQRWLKFVGIPLGLFLLAMLSSAVAGIEPAGAVAGTEPAEAIAGIGSAEAIGRSLFTEYVLTFEATSLLILIAVVGSLVLAKREP
jgi:NADH-quinone oxidoreductase subunit J